MYLLFSIFDLVYILVYLLLDFHFCVDKYFDFEV